MEGVSLMDAGEIAEVSAKDCIHLTRAGHRALGEAVTEKVKELLEL